MNHRVATKIRFNTQRLSEKTKLYYTILYFEFKVVITKNDKIKKK